MRNIKSLIMITAVAIFLLFGITACKNSPDISSDFPRVSAAEQSIGTLYNTGMDTGFSNRNLVGRDDIHYGWKLGEFSFDGYTSIDETDKNNLIISKNADQKVKMYFNLMQDITELNASESLSINQDINGYDKLLGVDKNDFGFGALVIKHDNPLDSSEKANTYFNFLSKKAKINSDVLAYEFDDGVYDVSLDYEIKKTDKKTEYINYKIAFRVTVQNNDGDAEKTMYNLGSTVKTGLDSGFSGNEKISYEDPHYGWSLGNFYVEGFTSCRDENKDEPVFLKNAGDMVALKFHLQQDIAKLNGKDKLSISEDINGYDESLGIEKTNFKRGALFIRFTDYQNKTGDPVAYFDYLAAAASQSADYTVTLCEEGDYEVVLDYEIKDKTRMIESHHNYRISFKFKVRNGNCMIFPREVGTGSELLNNAITKNGFYLDFAKSKYLDIEIKKSILVEGNSELTEDTRFNRPVKDKDEFTDEGVYTITAHNKYTYADPTVKVIYVGDDPILKSHFISGMPINEILSLLKQGAEIMVDGTISMPEPPESSSISGSEEISVPKYSAESSHRSSEKENSDKLRDDVPEDDNTTNNVIVGSIAAGFAIVILCVIAAFAIVKKYYRRR